MLVILVASAAYLSTRASYPGRLQYLTSNSVYKGDGE